MAKTYRLYVPEQTLPLPPDLREWLPDDDLAYAVLIYSYFVIISHASWLATISPISN